MAAATEVVARFTADISDVQSKMAVARGAFGAVGEAATFSSKRIAEVGQAMADVGKKMTVGITLPLGGIAVAASNAAMSFETGMNKIIGLVGIASEEVARMNGEVLNMASAAGKSPDELAAGLFVVTSAGLRGSEAMATLSNSAKASAAGLGQTNDIARAVAGALSAYGSEVLSASDATDAIVATARAGNFETSQFAAAIGRVLPFAQQAGASFQEMGGAVALLTRVNGDAAQSVTQIQALFRAFVVPTEEAKTALEEMGLSAQDLRDSIAKKGLPATLEMLDRALGGNREQLGRILGSSEAASAAFQILEADAQTLQETFGGVRNSAGMTAEAFGAVSQTTQFQVNQAMTELKATLIDLGQQFLPIIKSVMDFMQAHLKAFNSLPGPVKSTITVMAGLLAAIGPLLFIVGKLVVVFSGLLSLMLKTRAVGAMRAAFVGLRGDLAAARTSMKQTQTSIGMLGTAAQTAKIAVVTSFKAIGAAAKGLLAGLGPIGLAMIAVGAAFEIFIGKAAGAEHHLANLRDEIDLTTGKMTQAARLFIASELRTNISPEDLAMMESYGISISGFISALEQGGPALDAYREKIAAMQQAQREMGGAFNTGFGNIGTVNSINTIVENLDGMIGYYEDATLAAQDAANAQVDSAMAASEAARNMANVYRETAQKKRAADRAMTDSQKALDAALDAGVEAVEGLQAAFDKMNAAIADEASRDSAIQGIKDLNATLEENGSNIKKNSDEAMANRAAIREAAQGWIDYAAAAKDPEQTQKRLAQGQDEIRAALKKAGIKPEESDIFKVFKKQQSESKKTVDEFAAQRDIAERYGNEVGMNFIDGIIAELERRKEEVRAAAAAVTSGLTTGGNAGINADSPSRDAMMVAGNFADGLVVGLRSKTGEVVKAASQMAREFMRAFRQSLNPRNMGQMESAVADAIAQAQYKLKQARDRSRAANERVKQAERELNRVRKDDSATAKRVAAAEKEVAKARAAASRAADAQKAASWVQKNREGLAELQKVAKAFDNIKAKTEIAQAGFVNLGTLVAKPFGRASDISKMFGSQSDIDSVIDGFLSIRDQVEQAYSVLTDASIVGADAAARNRAEMDATIASLHSLTQQAVTLRRDYEAVMREMTDLEKSYQENVKKTNAFYDEAEKSAEENIRAIEERWATAIPALQTALSAATDAFDKENAVLNGLLAERDDFTNSIKSGFRSFVNSLSFESRAATKQIIRETQRLANGITVTLEREIEVGGGAGSIRQALQDRLDAVRAFSRNIRTLMERGLDPSLVRDFVTAGVEGAGEAAQALASGSQEDIAAINAIQSDLISEAGDFGDYASRQWHDIAIAQRRAIVGPLETARDVARKALDDANGLRQRELTAAQEQLAALRAARATTLAQMESEYNTKRAALQARAAELQAQMDVVAGQVEAKILDMVTKTATASAEAGEKAAQGLLDAFKAKYPELYDQLNELMTGLADSLNRTVTIFIQTVYESVFPDEPAPAPAPSQPGKPGKPKPPKKPKPPPKKPKPPKKRAIGGPVLARMPYLVGELGPELFVPNMSGDILPNHQIGIVSTPNGNTASPVTSTTVNINVTAGMGTDPAEVGRVVVEAIRKYERRSGPVFARA